MNIAFKVAAGVLAALTLLMVLVAPYWWIFSRQTLIQSDQTVTYYGRVIVGVANILYQTGLIQEVLAGFQDYLDSVDLKMYVGPSGDILRRLSDGTICIGFTHSPLLESKYVSEGRVEWLGIITYNTFIIAGPTKDPANVRGAFNVLEAFRRIYEAGEDGKIKFISRGDLSGTHVRELQLWNLTSLNPQGRAWYLRSAQGPAQTVLLADNIGAYVWVDEGTFKTLEGKINLKQLYASNDSYMLNVFSIVFSKHRDCAGLKGLSLKLRDYILGPGQEIIVDNYASKGLFYPVKGRERELEKVWESLAKLGG